MEMIADILLVAGAFGAAVYCAVLAARLRRFQTLEGGMGGAIAVLSAQVDEMTRALERARAAAEGQGESLAGLTARGEAAAKRLELILATMHDLPGAAPPPSPARTTAPAPGPVAPPRPDHGRRLRVLRRRSPRDGMAAAE